MGEFENTATLGKKAREKSPTENQTRKVAVRKPKEHSGSVFSWTRIVAESGPIPGDSRGPRGSLAPLAATLTHSQSASLVRAGGGSARWISDSQSTKNNSQSTPNLLIGS